MHKGPVSTISFDQTGSIFCTCSTDGHVFVFSGHASHNFKVIIVAAVVVIVVVVVFIRVGISDLEL